MPFEAPVTTAVLGVPDMETLVFLGGMCSARNTTNSSCLLFALLERPVTNLPTARISSRKAAEAGPLGRTRRRDSRGRYSGFGESGGAALHHCAGGREGRRQRRVAVSVFPRTRPRFCSVSKVTNGVNIRADAPALEDTKQPPLDRLRAWVHAFIRSECEEAAVRVALGDAAPLYRDVPEAQEARGSVESTIQTFMKEAAPRASDVKRALAGDLITRTLSEAGRRFSERSRSPEEIETYADGMADMFCSYLKDLGHG